MFFSNPELTKFLNDRFECSWEAMRPVPQVTIDFGSGRKLRRTLMGNIATWFCDADGLALDVIAGLCTLEQYRARAEIAERVHAGLRMVKDKSAALARFYTTRARVHRVATAGGERADLSKRRVERPVKLAVRAAPGQSQSVAVHRSSPKPSIKRTEGPIEVLRQDGEYNARYRDPKIYALLSERAGAKVHQLTNAVFEILDVDLLDPYLGLAPYVLGGERGRHGG